MKSIYLSLTSLFVFATSFSQTPCEDGFAGIYPCDKVDLMAFIPKTSLGITNPNHIMNDIWGWTDPLDGKEYVIACNFNGTAFIDISNPASPIYLGTLPTHTVNSNWRDAKVFNNYAFIVSEAGGHGMQVFDLTRLRNIANPPIVFTEDAHYGSFGNGHNIAINEATGYAYAVGTNTFSGGLHIVNINDPLNPVIAGDYPADGYTHDTQVVIYNGPHAAFQGKEIAFSSNENTVTITDVTDKQDTQTISISAYSGSAYTHQCWLTEDHRFLLVGDELDELQQLHNTRTYIWNVENLQAPVLVGYYQSSEAAIDHNLYTRGSNVYQSNYKAGLRILDMVDLPNGVMQEVGFFDVYPQDNDYPSGFRGSWSNYPYYASGVIAVSHMQEGVFIVRPKFMSASPAQASFCETDPVIINIEYKQGFGGPIVPTYTNLPAGADAVFSQTNFSPPALLTVEISGLAPGVHNPADWGLNHYSNIDVIANAMNFTITVVPGQLFYHDADQDGFGSNTDVVFACVAPSGHLSVAGDCDDNNDTVYPGAPATGFNVDNNCDGTIDQNEAFDCTPDLNGDGIISFADLVLFQADYGCMSGCIADFNGDNMVNFSDLTFIQSFYGFICP